MKKKAIYIARYIDLNHEWDFDWFTAEKKTNGQEPIAEFEKILIENNGLEKDDKVADYYSQIEFYQVSDADVLEVAKTLLINKTK